MCFHEEVDNWFGREAVKSNSAGQKMLLNKMCINRNVLCSLLDTGLLSILMAMALSQRELLGV